MLEHLDIPRIIPAWRGMYQDNQQATPAFNLILKGWRGESSETTRETPSK